MGVLQHLHGKAHDKAVFKRRIQVLAQALADFLPRNARVLDVGCGSGTLAKGIMTLRPDVTIEGIDVLVRPNTEIPVTEFDGNTIPWPDQHFDVALIVDVLHHTDDPVRVHGRGSARHEDAVSSSRIISATDYSRTARCASWIGSAMPRTGSACRTIICQMPNGAKRGRRSVSGSMDWSIASVSTGAVQLAVRPQAPFRGAPVLGHAGNR